jgi:excisionase family DNA binding protein
MSVAEAAKLLGVGEAAIRAAVRRGELPGVRVGKLIRIMRAPLLEKLGLPEDYEIE